MKTFLKVMSGLISLILSISLFALFTLCISLFSVKRSLSEESIKKAVSEIDFSSLIRLGDDSFDGSGLPFDMLSVNMGNAVRSLYTKTDINEDSNSGESDFVISDELMEKLADMGIDKAKIQEYLSSDLVNEMAGDMLSQYSAGLTKYLIDGETDVSVDAEYLHNLFEYNMDTIEVLFDVSLSEEEKSQFLGIVDDIAPEIEDSLPAYEDIETTITESSDVDFNEIRENYLRPFFSPVSTIIAVSALLAVCAMLALLSWSWYKWMIWAGVPMLLSGLSVLFGILIISGLAKTVILQGEPESAGLIKLLRPLSGSFILYGSLAVLFSIVLIVLYSLFASAARKAEQSRIFTPEAAYPAPQRYQSPQQYTAPEQYNMREEAASKQNAPVTGDTAETRNPLPPPSQPD